MIGSEGWRTFSPMVYVTKMADKLRKRTQFGIEKYGEQFRGDPLQHLEDELLDALFYIYIAKEQAFDEKLEKTRLTERLLK